METNHQGQAFFGRHPLMPELEVFFTKNNRHVFPAHSHDGIYAVGLMEAGASYCIDSGDDDSLVSAGKICLLNPGQVHSGIPAGGRPVSYGMIYIRKSWMEEASQEKGAAGCPEFTSLVIEGGNYTETVRRISRGIFQAEEPLILETELFELLFGMSQSRIKSGEFRHRGRRLPPVIRRVMEYLSGEMSEKVSLESVARAAGSSRYHLIRLFREATGLTPHAFRTGCRIDLARELLRNGSAPSLAGQEAGFCDQSHFIRTFKSYTGMTPGEYSGSLAQRKKQPR